MLFSEKADRLTHLCETHAVLLGQGARRQSRSWLAHAPNEQRSSGRKSIAVVTVGPGAPSALRPGALHRPVAGSHVPGPVSHVLPPHAQPRFLHRSSPVHGPSSLSQNIGETVRVAVTDRVEAATSH